MDFEAHARNAEPFIDLLVKGLFFSGLFFTPAFVFNWLAGREFSPRAFPGVIFGTLADKTSWIIGVIVWGIVAVIYFSKKNPPASSSGVDEPAHKPHGKKPETHTQPTDQVSNEGPPEIGTIRTQDAAAPTEEELELSQLKADLALLETKIETERKRYSRAVENFINLAQVAAHPSGKKMTASLGYYFAKADIEELSRTLPAMDEERYRLVAQIVELQSAAWSER